MGKELVRRKTILRKAVPCRLMCCLSSTGTSRRMVLLFASWLGLGRPSQNAGKRSKVTRGAFGLYECDPMSSGSTRQSQLGVMAGSGSERRHRST
eukprot:3354911-Karenia_brevis.AAC.1